MKDLTIYNINEKLNYYLVFGTKYNQLVNSKAVGDLYFFDRIFNYNSIFNFDNNSCERNQEFFIDVDKSKYILEEIIPYNFQYTNSSQSLSLYQINHNTLQYQINCNN